MLLSTHTNMKSVSYIKYNKYAGRQFHLPNNFNCNNLKAIGVHGSHFDIGTDMKLMSVMKAMLLMRACRVKPT